MQAECEMFTKVKNSSWWYWDHQRRNRGLGLLVPSFKLWQRKEVLPTLMLLGLLNCFPQCLIPQVPPMPQDHPSWKRGGAGPGCFTACFLWWHCFCCLPVSAWSVSWKGTKVGCNFPLPSCATHLGFVFQGWWIFSWLVFSFWIMIPGELLVATGKLCAWIWSRSRHCKAHSPQP